MHTSLFPVSWQKGKALYLLLWIGGAIVALIIVLVGNDDSTKKYLFKNQNQRVNDLLLSAAQLNIAEKKSFINPYLRLSESDSVAASPQTETESENFNRRILNNQLNKQRARNHKEEDFSVGHAP